MIVNQNSIKNFKILLDIFFLNIAFALAAIIAQSLDLYIQTNLLLVLQFVLSIVWVITTRSINFYENVNNKLYVYQFIKLIRNLIPQVLTAILFIFFVKEGYFTRNFIIIYSLLLLVFISARHFAFESLLRKLRRRGKGVRDIIIVGYNENAIALGRFFCENPNYGYNLIGYIANQKVSGQIIGSTNELTKTIKSNPNIDAVFIALERSEQTQISQIIKTCNLLAISTHIIPDYSEFLSKRFVLSTIGGLPVLSVRNVPLEEFQWKLIKRFFDLAICFISFVFLIWWLFPLIGFLIKIDSRGPIFYKQKRIGRHGKLFTCYKFRSMVINTNDRKFIPTTNADPRITKFGKILRKTNIDELPQIINVFLGDMSLVGPRPHTPIYEEHYSHFFEEIKLRNILQPGITGWAQVNGLRGDDPDPAKNELLIKKRIEFDIWYVENWSFLLDIQIILLTVWKMFTGKAKGT